MLLGDLIYEYRSKHKLSQRDFAKICDISHTYVAALEKKFDPRSGKLIAPTLEAVKNISNGMNMPLNELLDIIDDEQEFNIMSDENHRAKRIDIYGSIPAGVPLEMIGDIVDFEDISPEMLKGGKEYFGIKVKGNSMTPDYQDGDTLIVLKQNDCESGEECIIAINGYDATFKRVLKSEHGITLQPLNNEYEPVFYTNEQIETLPITIIGVVVETRRTRKRNK